MPRYLINNMAHLSKIKPSTKLRQLAHYPTSNGKLGDVLDD